MEDALCLNEGEDGCVFVAGLIMHRGLEGANPRYEQ